MWQSWWQCKGKWMRPQLHRPRDWLAKMCYPQSSGCCCMLGTWLLKLHSHRQKPVAREKCIHLHPFWQKPPCSCFGCQQIAAVIWTPWPIYKYSTSPFWMVVKLKSWQKLEMENKVEWKSMYLWIMLVISVSSQLPVCTFSGFTIAWLIVSVGIVYANYRRQWQCGSWSSNLFVTNFNWR